MAASTRRRAGPSTCCPSGARAGRGRGRAAAIFARAGYEPIATPAFEDTELFERGVGSSTDIVRKEMFTFEDKGERSLTLRPEGTAPICRAYLEHGMHKLAQPVKLSYLGPFFRHERPQAGPLPPVPPARARGDRERLAAGRRRGDHAALRPAWRARRAGVELRLGSLGSLEARRAYLEELKGHLRSHEGELSEDVASGSTSTRCAPSTPTTRGPRA
jgi:histidyl-tRNA synthetase